MGLRLHYATTYKVAYGGGEFNWKIEKLNTLMCELFNEIEISEDGYTIYTPKTELEKVIEYMIHLPLSDINALWNDEDYTWCDLINFFKKALCKAEKSITYVKFSWF